MDLIEIEAQWHFFFLYLESAEQLRAQLLQLPIVTPVRGVISLYICNQTSVRISPFIIRFEHLNIANSKSIEFLFKRVKQEHRISTPQRPHSAHASSHSTTISILRGEPFPAMHLSRSPPHRSPPPPEAIHASHRHHKKRDLHFLLPASSS